MKILALDIGNVCLAIHPERCFLQLGFDDPRRIPPELLSLEADRLECGKLAPEQFLAAVLPLLPSPLAPAAIEAAFRAIIGNPLPGMNELIASLPARGIRPVFFSDTSTVHLEEVRRRFPAAAVIPEGVYSFDCGARKKDDPMFERFEERFGKPFLDVDDNPQLIVRARARGWRAEVFTGAAALEKMLFCRGEEKTF